MNRSQLCAALLVLALALALLGSEGLGSARAQESRGDERAQPAAPDSRSRAERPLRDPTRAPGWRPTLGGGAFTGELPELRLRGRVVSSRGALALLEVEGRLHIVRPGDALSLSLAHLAPGAPLPSSGRGARPAAPTGRRVVTLRVVTLSAEVLELEFVELGRTLSLR